MTYSSAYVLGERVPDEGGRVRGLFSPLTLLASLPLRAAEFPKARGGDARDEVTPHPAVQGRHPLPTGEGWFPWSARLHAGLRMTTPTIFPYPPKSRPSLPS